MLNGVFDVQATKRREIWYEGRLVWWCAESYTGQRLSGHAVFDDPFGHYPDKPVQRRIVCASRLRSSDDRVPSVRGNHGFFDNSTPPQFVTPTEALHIAVAAGQILPERPLVEGQTELKTENLY